MAPASAPPRLAYAAWIAVCLIWGTTYLAILIALETIPPMLIGGLRFMAAGAALCLFVLARGGRLPPVREWTRQAALGTLLLGVGNGAVVWSELWIPSGIAAVGVAALPFWMSGAEAAFGGDRLRGRVLVGLFAGFLGIVLLIWPSLFAADVNGPRFGLGVLLVQVACLGWAVGSSMSRRTQSTGGTAAASALQQLFAGVLLMSVGTALGEWSRLAFTPRTIAAELYLIVFGSLIAYSAYLYALKHLPVATVSLYAYINPVIAVMLGTLFAGERFSPRIVAAAALVLGGVAIVRTAPRGGP
ncbi:MAG: EamA family transporter [Vicinamibacterales bacterium]